MAWQSSPYIWFLLAAAIFSLAAAVPAWHRHGPGTGAAPVAVLLVAVAWWSVCLRLGTGSLQFETKIFWAQFQYLAIGIVPTAWLAFTLQYAGLGSTFPFWAVALLAIEPALTVLFAWTTRASEMIYRAVALVSAGSYVYLDLR